MEQKITLNMGGLSIPWNEDKGDFQKINQKKLDISKKKKKKNWKNSVGKSRVGGDPPPHPNLDSP